MIDLTTMTARKIADSVRRKELTAVEVAQSTLDQIGRLNGTLRAFITVTRDEAMAAAEQVDRQVAAGRGDALPLAGVPMAIKDSFWTKGVRTTGGTKMLADFVPTEDATAVARLRAAGCVLVGKSAMHEMAYGFTSRNPHYGDCHNPWDPTRIPGGSSGGNAAALATGMAFAAIGGDTGGSNRQPAALCGVVGVKVTYGRVSRHGGIPLSWSMDTVGPMARTVGDAAALLQVMAGYDPKDPTTRRDTVPNYLAGLNGGLKGIRIGIPHDHFMAMMEPDVGAAIQDALGVLKKQGATLVDVRFPPLDPVVGAHRAIIFSEAAAAHEELIRTRAGGLLRRGPAAAAVRAVPHRDPVSRRPAGAEEDHRRLSGDLAIVRRAGHADQPDRRASDRRDDDAVRRQGHPAGARLPRPDAAVQPDRSAGDLGAVRVHEGGVADRPPARRAAVRRGHALPRRRGLRGGDRLAFAHAGDRGEGKVMRRQGSRSGFPA